jgi:putative holliday junction resolvase
MKILAVDPGIKKIGLAVCDATGTAARALRILPAQTIESDCERILQAAMEEQAELILVGISHEPGTPASPSARAAHRLLARLRSSTKLRVLAVDETLSTRAAQQARRERGDPLKKRRAADDALAAAALLQEYLDAQTHPAE